MSFMDWVDLDLRCYMCDEDLWLTARNDRQALFYCSAECGLQAVALSVETIGAFKAMLDRIGTSAYLESVGALAVADAMLDGRPGDVSGPNGFWSHQWRSRRIEQIEKTV